MSKIRNIFICHRRLLIFRREAICHDSVMSACENMEKKAATDVRKLGKRCLLVRWSNVEEVDQEYSDEHCTSSNRKATPGMPNDGLPEHLPWLSLPLSHGVEGDPQQPGNQAGMEQRQMKLKEMRGVKA